MASWNAFAILVAVAIGVSVTSFPSKSPKDNLEEILQVQNHSKMVEPWLYFNQTLSRIDTEPTIGSAPECSIDTFDMIDIAEGQAMTLFSPNFPDHSGPFIPVSSCGWYFRGPVGSRLNSACLVDMGSVEEFFTLGAGEYGSEYISNVLGKDLQYQYTSRYAYIGLRTSYFSAAIRRFQCFVWSTTTPATTTT